MSKIEVVEQVLCHDYGHVDGCLKFADPAYTITFPDDQPDDEPVRWCSNCGKAAKEIQDFLVENLPKHPDLQEKFDRASLINELYKFSKEN